MFRFRNFKWQQSGFSQRICYVTNCQPYLSVFFIILASGFFLIPDLASAEVADLSRRMDLLETALSDATSNQQSNADHIWTMAAAALVLLMQIGFLFIEAGMVRSKNSINVAQKNIADLLMSVSLFYAVGFGLMFGPSIGGLIGFGTDLFAWDTMSDWHYTFFVFQAMFVGTAATIVSGAVAGRMTFGGYILLSAMIGLVIYPVVGHWAWGNLLIDQDTPWLASKGFIDFAGSTVVHSTGAWIALASIIVLGPRIGKFDSNGNSHQLQGHSVVLATAGAIILFVGWIGFNGGSTTAGTPAFAHIVANTVLAATMGGAIGLIVGRVRDGIFYPYRSINGMLAALVGITAGCDAVSPHGAALIGLICGVIVIASEDFIEDYLKLDDVVGAVSVHGVCGAIGTLAVAFLATDDKLLAGTRWDQFLVQAEGVIATFVWAFGFTFVLLKIVNPIVRLRVSAEHEEVGLNVSEHGATLGTYDAMKTLEAITSGESDLSVRLDAKTGDESADLAMIVNPFLDRIQELVGNVSNQSGTLADTLSDLSLSVKGSADAITNRSKTVATVTDGVHREINTTADVSDKVSIETRAIAENANLVSNDIRSLADTVSELLQSIRTIGTSARGASDVATKARELSRTSRGAISSLHEAATEVGGVIELIIEIQSQTNLLALNATIEAVHAGEAGKGFAIVAHQVKELSNKTALATEQIKSAIERVLENADGVGTTLSEVDSIIGTINNSVQGICQTSDKEGDAVENISSGMVVAADSIADVSQGLGTLSDEVKGASTSARRAAEEVNAAIAVVAQLENEAQQNARTAENVESSAKSLTDIADDLGERAGALATGS